MHRAALVARRRARAEGFDPDRGQLRLGRAVRHGGEGAYETLRDEILAQLQVAMPVDGVLLGLHGAMVAHGYDDCEGDLSPACAHRRAKVPIGVEHDPHCHLTEKRLRGRDIIVCFKEFPHTDTVERAEEVVLLTLRPSGARSAP